jgi:formylglycine-generating enzyme required for sulfatase activity
LAKPFATENNTPAQTQEIISQPTATTSPTEISTRPASSSDNLPSEITDDAGVSMALVSEGEFTMGSDVDTVLAECQKYKRHCEPDDFIDEEPLHQIYLDAYYIDKYEVTNALYKACVGEGFCGPPQENGSYDRVHYYDNSEFDNYPVISVDWNQAKTYCEWRGTQLPTEAQWEKAARGPDGRTYPWGEGPDCSKANYKGCQSDTAVVGGYESGISPYGLYDMAGNVWEWVADWYSDAYYQSSPLSNPLGPESGELKLKIFRGGSWAKDEISLRSAHRGWLAASLWSNLVGLRCARDVYP